MIPSRRGPTPIRRTTWPPPYQVIILYECLLPILATQQIHTLVYEPTLATPKILMARISPGGGLPPPGVPRGRHLEQPGRLPGSGRTTTTNNNDNDDDDDDNNDLLQNVVKNFVRVLVKGLPLQMPPA